MLDRLFSSLSTLRLLSLALVLTLAACASSPEEDAADRVRETERELYETAQRQLRTQQWDLAISNLQRLEDNFPFGTYAEQAQLELIYGYYRNFDFEASIAAAERFIRLHPRHRNVDYAYYMRGLASFDQSRGFFDRFLPTDMSQRDPGAARESFGYFNQLLTLFPDSQYAPDAEKRMVYLRNLLARYEIHVANYYFKRGAYLAAVNRGRYVVENFQQTPAVPDALAVMVQGYKLLGLDDLQQSTLAILTENYPEHPALTEDGQFNFQFSTAADERSWLSRLTFGLFDKREPPGFDSRSVYNPEFQVD
ncbi:outer membrane protein assembly factor BamD [Gilvimarinus sp. F26214L]|uniref:outer membrane protein assembly factor BamD n=1 Tax=Gilvimarinus sp. DZF01 TaxID=3461371 RepID=UPI0040458677